MESEEAEVAAAGAASPSGGNVTSAPKKRGRKPKSKEESQTQEERGGKMKESGKKTKQEEQSVDEKYTQWKGLVPILYDSLANHNLVWPSLSCRSFLSLSLSLSLLLLLGFPGLNCLNWQIFDEVISSLVLRGFVCCLAIGRWGPQLEQATYKNRQRLYLSEQVRFFLAFSCILLAPLTFVGS